MEGYGLYTNIRRDYTFSGTPNTGDQTHTVSYTNYSTDPQATEGANLIGNPYPSSIDWNDLDDNWGAVYIWNPDYDNGDGTLGKYMSWNNGSGINGGTPYIAPMQAFFVIAEEVDNGSSLILTNRFRTHNGANNYYKSKNHLAKGLILEAITNGSADELCIKFNENTSNNYDKRYDALKLFSNSLNSCQLYSISGEKHLSIDTRPEEETIQLGLRNQKAGPYKIAIKDADGFHYMGLEDTKLNKFHDLTQGAYSFDWQTTDSEERFILHLKATGSEEMEAQDAQVYAANGLVYVRMDEADKFDEIMIYDLAGRRLYQNQLSHQNLQSFDLSYLQGAYLVQLKGKIKVRTKKVVL
jgi:hypothetical protein